MADTTPSDAQDFVTAQVDLQVAGTRVQFALTVPTAPVPPGAILPVFQTLSAAIQADVASGLEEEGKRISCRAGCGACCRQLVPITKIEARYLAELVDSMPEPRQSEIRSRFADVIRRLEEAGILETLRHPEWVLPETKEKLGLTYFGLGIPCPFLENESCSIHENRPLVCREFLVTSPPEHCANRAGKLVEGGEAAGANVWVSRPVRRIRAARAWILGRASAGAGVGRISSRRVPGSSRSGVG